MKLPKLYLHLQTLSSKELRRFTDFVSSRYFTRHEETRTFFKALIRFHPDYAVSDEALFAAAFPGRPYDNARLRVLRTYVLELLHKFWVHEEVDQNESLSTDLLLKALSGHGLTQDQHKLILKAQGRIDPALVGSLDQAFHAYRLAESLADVTSRTDNRLMGSVLQALLQRLDRFAIGSRLKILCAVANSVESNLTPARYEQGMRETLELCERLDLLADPLVGIYYHLLHLRIQASHELHYPRLIALVREHQETIAEEELVNIFGFLINHCLFATQRGRTEFLRIAFETYQEMIALDLLFGKGGFSAHNYKNILSLGARLKEFEWTRKFLEETYERIPEQFREGVFHYGHAYLDFAQGSYSSAKRHLLKVEFYDLLYRSSHQALLLRIYFETSEADPFFNLLETFRRYLNRNPELSDNVKTSLLNFLRLIKKVFEFKTGTRKQATREVLREEIIATNPLVDRIWILEKLMED